MKKHNFKFNLHCEICWDKFIKYQKAYYGSQQWIEDERRRIEMIDKLNAPLIERLNKL